MKESSPKYLQFCWRRWSFPQLQLNHQSREDEWGLANLSKPQRFPKHGCSKNPDDYAQRIDDHGGVLIILDSPMRNLYHLVVSLPWWRILVSSPPTLVTTLTTPTSTSYIRTYQLERWLIHATFPMDITNNKVRNEDAVKEADTIALKKQKWKRELCWYV